MEEIMLTSGFNFEGYRITKYIGFISGECALGTGFLSSMDAGIADFFGSTSNIYEEKLSKAKSMALNELKTLAEGKGANAIIGVDVNYTTFSADIMGVAANGTAVKIEPIQESRMSLNSVRHSGTDGNNICFPVINYYKNLPIRPFDLELDRATNGIKISILNYNEQILGAINVDVIANTIFGTTYEYPDINFIDFQVKDNIAKSEDAFLNIDDNQLKIIESITVRIKHYILDGERYSIDEPYQFSDMPIEQLHKFRKSYGEDVVSDFREDGFSWICMCGFKNDADKNKCVMCERTKGEYTRAKKGKKVCLGDLMEELSALKDCQEISVYLGDIEQKREFRFPETIMNEVAKMVQMERAYGNMKDSLMDTLQKYVAENE